jgi:glycosyltransferase involved in cell wall biosynthesis
VTPPAGLPAWTVAQIGARESYAAARAFAPAGRLNRLYTDVWCRYAGGLLRRGPAALRAVAGRWHAAVPNGRVVSFTPSALWRDVRGRFGRSQSTADEYESYLRVGRWFDRRVLAHIDRHPLDPAADAFFTYNTGALDCLRALRRRGVVALVDQMDTARVGYDLVREEAAKWPGWEPSPPVIPDAYFDRLAAEWEAAAGVVVNSEWTATALVRQGVPRESIHVIPLAYDPPVDRPPARPRVPARRPLVVLWLGNVVLQKGIQYLIEAARLLTDRSIRFVVVGQVGISRQAVGTAPPSVEFVGRVTRDRVAEVYRTADLFVFPTLSDGFGLTQLEAMAHGLPVIATPNCGSVVEHGRDGLVVPAADPAGLAAAVAALDDDRPRLEAMGRQAVTKGRLYPLGRFADRLDAAARTAAGDRRRFNGLWSDESPA